MIQTLVFSQLAIISLLLVELLIIRERLAVGSVSAE
jgi:hypothetical protein